MRRITLLLVPFLLAGCAGSALRPETPSPEEIQALKNRLVELQREAAMNQVELAQLRQQVAELEVRGGGVRPPSRSPQTLAPSASLPPSSPAPSPQPARPYLPPAAPVVKNAPPPSSPRPVPQVRREPVPAEPIEEVDIELPEKGPQPPPRHAGTSATAKPPRPSAPAVPAPKPSPLPAPPAASRPDLAPAPVNPGTLGEEAPAAPDAVSPATQALYDRGYSLYHQGHFVDAEASFQRFLQGNPKSELADNAQYWIGECRYSRNDLKGALAAFREVVERFPKGNKVPDAMLKSGQCLEGMGDTEGARVTYREVVRRFPATAAAAVAEERRSKLH